MKIRYLISNTLLKNKLSKYLLLFGMFFIIPHSYAESIPVNGFMDELLHKLTGNNSLYFAVFVPAAKALYAGLVTIEIAFDTGIRMLKDGGPMKVIGVLIVRICVLLLWFAILDNPNWIQSVVDQALSLTSRVGGASNQITPSYLAGLGVQFFDSFMSKIDSADFSLVHMNNIIFGLVAVFVGLSIVVLFTMIGIIFFIAKVETTMVLSIAVILIGFLGSTWTSNWGKSYIAHVVAVSLKLSVMMILIGLIPDATASWPNKIINSGEDFGTLLNVAVYIALCALVLFFLVMSVPSMLAGMITGVSTVTISGGLDKGSTIATAGSTFASGVSAFANGARNNFNNAGSSGSDSHLGGRFESGSTEQTMAPSTSKPPTPASSVNNSQDMQGSSILESARTSYQDLQKTDGSTSVSPPTTKNKSN